VNVSRQILHVDMDAFFVSVERLHDPSLVGRPVVVGGDPEGRGVVASASYEARKYGIRSAMPMARARRLCPRAVFIRGDYEKYARASARLFRLLRRHSPSVEPVSIDEAYLDLTGTRRLLGHPVEAAERIRREIEEELGLSASVGMASNKLVAKVASRCAKPSGLLYVMPGREASFLSPLPVGMLPGIGEKTGTHLRRLGIRRIGELARLDEELLRIAFGRTGSFLRASAMGLGEETLDEDRGPARSVSRERTFETDTTDPDVVVPTAFALAESACSSLREDGLVARRVTLKLRYSDFRTVTRSAPLPEPTAMDRLVFPALVELVNRAWERRTRIRLVGVSLSGLGPAHCEIDLFEDSVERRLVSLYRGIDAVRRKYGPRSIFVARELLLRAGS